MNSLDLDIIKQHIIKTLTLYNLSRKNKSLRAELDKIYSLADKLSENNGWISIKENGLPKENGKYLVYNYANNQVWMTNFHNYCGFNNHHEKVTHYIKIKFPNFGE